ncbi:MAG: peptidoglycan-binding protein [Bifidobacteriaceae bacterium]|jgi:peptidoglycan hydrolase-like protein with peptidoglycan-binding domain|nr:peptidoglycan-binding protein [Bifidobacteriaceae bacterium]
MRFLKNKFTKFRVLLKGRNGWLVCLILSSLIIGFLGFLVGLNIKSPNQLKAESASPDATPITAKVQLQKIKNLIIARGDIKSTNSYKFGVGKFLLDGSVDKLEGSDILTDLFIQRGDIINEGQNVAEINGRPVIIMRGEKVSSRDIKTGDQGYDVSQLQESLSRLGFYWGDISGVFDSKTGDSVRSFYNFLGYEPLKNEIAKGQLSQSGENGNNKVLDEKASSDEIIVPQKEIMFAPIMPLYVSNTAHSVGYQTPQVIFEAATSDLHIEAQVNQADCQIINISQKVEFTINNRAVAGKINSVCDSKNNIIVKPNEVIDYSQIDKNIKVEIVVQSSDKEVLTVPLTAISTNSSGQTLVNLVKSKDSNYQLQEVQVIIGIKNSEECQITPILIDSIKDGDDILIGNYS